MDFLRYDLSGLLAAAKSFIPSLIAALLILVAGILSAMLLRFLLRRVIRSLDRIIPSRRLRQGLQRAGLARPAADLLSGVVFWLVLLVFVAAAAAQLGLPVLSTWLSQITAYLPGLLSALLILFAGVTGAAVLRDTVSAAAASIGLQYATALGRLTQMTVILVAVVVATDQLGLNVDIVTNLFITFLGAILLGGALAFGLGARTTVGNILACYYLQKTYAVGHKVRIGGLDGEIVEITPTAVILDSSDGRILIPAKTFSEDTSILLTKVS